MSSDNRIIAYIDVNDDLKMIDLKKTKYKKCEDATAGEYYIGQHEDDIPLYYGKLSKEMTKKEFFNEPFEGCFITNEKGNFKMKVDDLYKPISRAITVSPNLSPVNTTTDSGLSLSSIDSQSDSDDSADTATIIRKIRDSKNSEYPYRDKNGRIPFHSVNPNIEIPHEKWAESRKKAQSIMKEKNNRSQSVKTKLKGGKNRKTKKSKKRSKKSIRHKSSRKNIYK
jgi:hypothetical protein